MTNQLLLTIEPVTFSLLGQLNQILASAGIQAYVVGGLIRDTFLGKTTSDIDIAVDTEALRGAGRVAGILGGSFVPLDEINRIGRVVLPQRETQGRCFTIDFSTFPGTIEEDLSRRDFTIDAMALSLMELAQDSKPAHLIDPFHGSEDLERGTIRLVSQGAFVADPVRLLRAVRLAAELDFTLEQETEARLLGEAKLVSRVPGERVREELLRILGIPKSGSLLTYLDRLGLLTQVIPELEVTKGVSQPKEHFWDVFRHSLESVAVVDFLLRRGEWADAGSETLTSVPWSGELKHYFDLEVSSGSTRRLMLKLATLLHDIAKPQTKAPDDTGRIRFLGHGNEGAELVTNIMERLRFSAREIKLVATMVKYHLRPGQMRQDDDLPTSRAIYRYFRDTGDAGIAILFLNLADHLATRGPNLEPDAWRENTKLITYMLMQYYQQKEVATKERLLTGDDLIKAFGLKPGPEIGRILEKVHEAQAAEEVKSHEAALALARSLLTESREEAG